MSNFHVTPPSANGSKCPSNFFLTPVWFLLPYAPYPRLPKNYLELCPKREGPTIQKVGARYAGTGRQGVASDIVKGLLEDY